MKKSSFNPLFIAIPVLAFVLIGAAVWAITRNGSAEDAEIPQLPLYQDIVVYMEPATPEFLASFSSYHSLDFREIHTAFWGYDNYWLQINSPAVVTSNSQLHGFQVIGLELEFVDDGVIAWPSHVYYEIDVFIRPLVLNWFFTTGLFPNNGISFLDSGSRRYFAINAGYGHEWLEPFQLIEFTPGQHVFTWEVEDLYGELCEICGDHFVGDDLRHESRPINFRDVHVGYVEFFDEHIDGFLQSRFATVHTTTYVRHGDAPGQNLRTSDMAYPVMVLWSDVTLYDFQFVSLSVQEDVAFVVQEVLLTVDVLQPTHAVALKVQLFHYLMPRVGFMFTDAQGVEHHLLLFQSMRGGCWPYWHIAFFDGAISELPEEDDDITASVDIMYLLGQGDEIVPLADVRHQLGTLVEVVDDGGDFLYVFENGLTAVDSRVFYIYYSNPGVDWRAFNFGGVDGTSTFEDVVTRFGEPHIGGEFYALYRLFDDTRYVQFFFGAGGLVDFVQFWVAVTQEPFTGDGSNLYDLIFQYVSEVWLYLGALLETVSGARHIEHYFDTGLFVEDDHGYVVSLFMVFDDYNRERFHFEGFDGNSTREQVVDLFGEPYIIRQGYDEERLGAAFSYGFWRQYTFVMFFFDWEGGLVAINHFW